MTNKHAQILGKLGGKKSVEVRLGGMNKEQKSELMKKVRSGKNFTDIKLTEEDKKRIIEWLKKSEQITN